MKMMMMAVRHEYPNIKAKDSRIFVKVAHLTNPATDFEIALEIQ